MRHRVAGRTFGRRPDQRKALLRGLATALLDHGRIETTVPKAKELRRVVEPLVTLGKRGDLHARRQAAAYLYRPETLQRLFGEIAARFKDRAGGYTRIYRLGQRRGDGAEMCLIELLDNEKKVKKAKTPKKETEKKAEEKEKTEAKPAAKSEGKATKGPKAEKKPAAKKKTEKKS
jgi:large subunit ribosomal protein L17